MACAQPPAPGIPVRREDPLPHATPAVPARYWHQPPKLPPDPIGGWCPHRPPPQFRGPATPARAPRRAARRLRARRDAAGAAPRQDRAGTLVAALPIAGHGLPAVV